MGEGLGFLGRIGTPMPAGLTVGVAVDVKGAIGEGDPNPAGL